METFLKQHSLDANLRGAVTVEISAFLAAFDAAVEQQTSENLELLRTATDKLMRVAAGVRIELERVEESRRSHA